MNGKELAHSLICSACVIILLLCHNSKSLTFSQRADNAQQAFSSDQVSTLHLAIPALEALHKAWSDRTAPTRRQKYERFVPALQAACTKIDEYYEKTTESPAYIMAMSKITIFPYLNKMLILF